MSLPVFTLDEELLIRTVSAAVEELFRPAKNGGYPGAGYNAILAKATDWVRTLDVRDLISRVGNERLEAIVNRVVEEELEKHIRATAAKMRKQGALFETTEGKKP